MFEPIFFNRDENGTETNIDGFETPFDSDLGLNDKSRAFTSEAIEEDEPQLADER